MECFISIVVKGMQQSFVFFRNSHQKGDSCTHLSNNPQNCKHGEDTIVHHAPKSGSVTCLPNTNSKTFDFILDKILKEHH